MWLILIPAALVICAGALASYNESCRGHWLYVPMMALVGAANCILWAIASKISKSPNELFALSLAWDALTIVAYSALPVMCSGVRLNLQMVVGLVLVVAGTVIVKLA